VDGGQRSEALSGCGCGCAARKERKKRVAGGRWPVAGGRPAGGRRGFQSFSGLERGCHEL